MSRWELIFKTILKIHEVNNYSQIKMTKWLFFIFDVSCIIFHKLFLSLPLSLPPFLSLKTVISFLADIQKYRQYDADAKWEGFASMIFLTIIINFYLYNKTAYIKQMKMRLQNLTLFFLRIRNIFQEILIKYNKKR